MTDPGERSSLRPLDARALEQVLRRLERAAEAPWLHGEVARRMAERLPLIRSRPEVVLDWWAANGASRLLLQRQYPAARIVAVERLARPAAPPHAGGLRDRLREWRRGRRGGGANVAEAAVAPGRAQLVWANMMLHGVQDPEATMRRWRDALAVGGFLMFSTLGPGSFARLRACYAAAGWPPPHAPFVDMHDLGDMLLHAGFADPVMDQESLVLTHASPAALLQELRTLGGNVDPARHAGLRTPGWRARLEEALAAGADARGRVALDVEVVYGHAFRPEPRAAVAPRTDVPLAEMRAALRAARRR